MTDFRSRGEQREHFEWDQQRQRKAAQNKEIKNLHARIADLEKEQKKLKSDLELVTKSYKESVQALRKQVEAGVNKLTEDNKRLHTLIRSAQQHDMQLVEQMDKNHRERLDSILRTIDQKALPDG